MMMRLLGHDLYGVRAIGLIDAHRPRCADAIAVQEDHDFANDLLFGPSGCDPVGPNRAYGFLRKAGVTG
jgi:hypothetical protein